MYKSRAPLRLGLAGGGTDVSPYSDEYGGAVLNATINLYTYATIKERNDGKIVIKADDMNEEFECSLAGEIDLNGSLHLHKGVYNRIVKDFIKKPLSFELITASDAPPGSGLGTSSTMVVTIIGAFIEWLKIPLNKAEIARLAYEIERVDLEMEGGKQDQYAATYGGMNFMEFAKGNQVNITPVEILPTTLNELENKLLLYNTDTSRVSAEIIKNQTEQIKQHRATSIQAMDSLKEQAYLMKYALTNDNLDKIAVILDQGWENKKQLATGITTSQLDKIYEAAKNAGATGGKISGAGGGGFFFFYCPNGTQEQVKHALSNFGGRVRNYQFTKDGLTTWSV